MSSAIEGLVNNLVSAAFFGDGLFCVMGHFRFGSLVLVEEIIKTLCVQTPIIVQATAFYLTIINLYAVFKMIQFFRLQKHSETT